MLEFYIGKTRITMDFGFFAVIAFFCMLDSGKHCINAFTACIIHELGHTAVMGVLGSSAAQLRFSGTGIRIIPHKNSVLPISRDIAILLGGPFANILVWAVLLPIGKAQSFAYMNLFLGFFNLLPYRSLDGGEAIISLSEYSGGCGRAMRAEKVLAFVNILLAAVIAAVAVKHEFMSFTLLVMLVWLTAEELLGQREK